MNELPFTVRFVFAPFSNILCAVSPYLLTVAIPKATFPLAGVLGACFKSVRGSLFARLILSVNPAGKSFPRLFVRKVLTRPLLFGPQHPNVMPRLSSAPPGLNHDNVSKPLLQVPIVALDLLLF